jgi:hypothetical protein
MDTRLIVRLAGPQEKNMSKRQQEFVSALRERIKAEGIRVELDGLDYDRLEERYEIVRRCHGVLVVALAQWRSQRLYRDEDRSVLGPSEFTHVANAMAVAAGKPLLVLREKDVAQRGSLKEGYVHPVVAVPTKAGPEWLNTSTFQDTFTEWLKKVRRQKHVFLAYSTRAKPMADAVHRFLVDKLKLSVLDWTNLPASNVIMDNIAEAERLTVCGIFLFTKDDEVENSGIRQDVPRDNVVFEAGFFAGAKGPKYVLLIHERGAKIPTDLGGFVYLEVKKRVEISAIEIQIADYFTSRFQR